MKSIICLDVLCGRQKTYLNSLVKLGARQKVYA